VQVSYIGLGSEKTGLRPAPTLPFPQRVRWTRRYIYTEEVKQHGIQRELAWMRAWEHHMPMVLYILIRWPLEGPFMVTLPRSMSLLYLGLLDQKFYTLTITCPLHFEPGSGGNMYLRNVWNITHTWSIDLTRINICNMWSPFSESMAIPSRTSKRNRGQMRLKKK
jgi:hypothetical protein